jgi:uncharacterized protein YcaQ
MRRESRVERSHPGLLDRVREFVCSRAITHLRDLDADHGRQSVTNYWGGSSSATTHASVRQLASMLRYGAPHLALELMDRRLIERALDGGGLRAVVVNHVEWILPAGERINGDADDRVRPLAPFDPVVWDRRRFQSFWGWSYRFEAYTPAPKRMLGYYALPLLWRDAVIGWGNLCVTDERLEAELGFIEKRPRDAAFTRELDAELERFARFMRTSRKTRIALRR